MPAENEKYWENNILPMIQTSWKIDPYKFRYARELTKKSIEEAWPPAMFVANISMTETSSLASTLSKIHQQFDQNFFISNYGLVPSAILRTVEATQGTDIKEMTARSIAREGKYFEPTEYINLVNEVTDIFRDVTRIYLEDRTGFKLSRTMEGLIGFYLMKSEEPMPNLSLKLVKMGGERYRMNYESYQKIIKNK